VRREAADGLHVSRALWDSWDDDAVVRDVSTSRYLDRDRVHYVDFEGATYSIKGPATVPRPPQGHVVVLASPTLVDPAAVDVALVGGHDVAAVAAAASAATDAPRRFAEVEVALDTPDATGSARVADLERHAPWPDAGRLRHVGGGDGLVRLLTELADHVDGVRLHPLVIDEDLAVLSKLVIPRLVIGGTSTRPLPGHTLRATLGIERPANQFATATAATGG
jgi:alkanesulfonate monooxygenase SsuD/methylene tetrahydromethanopterin reductase-like flavin-dependent oxidoreductase (luciferase family)